MQNSESNPILPYFGKNLQLSSSIAPFKPSLAKNPSYFSLVRSPEVFLEKKKLKEENWKLKQMLHSLNEENLKLKQKLSQKSEINRLILNEGLQAINQNKYIDVLQESLKTLKSDLSKKKHENVEMRKKIYKIKDDKPPEIQKFTSSRHSTDRQSVEISRELHEKTIAELSKTISYLKSEVKILQEENSVLESAKTKNQLTIKQLESSLRPRGALSVTSVDAIQVSVPVSVNKLETVPRIPMISLNSMATDSERILKREALKNEQANLRRFFRNFFNEMQLYRLKTFDILAHIRCLETIEFTLDAFINLLKHFSIKLPKNEIEETYFTISKEKSFTNDDFIKIYKQYEEELDSDRSSDISSGSSPREHMVITIRNDPNDKINMIIDNIALGLVQYGISESVFEGLCKEHLPDIITPVVLYKFLYEHARFIPEDNDKNKIAINFMQGQSTKSKNDVVNKMIGSFFAYSHLAEQDKSSAEKVLKKIAKRREFFDAKFIELDTKKKGTLSWNKVYSALYGNNAILFEEIDGFKFHCYLLSNSLKKITYSALLFDKIDDGSEDHSLIKKQLSMKT